MLYLLINDQQSLCGAWQHALNIEQYHIYLELPVALCARQCMTPAKQSFQSCKKTFISFPCGEELKAATEGFKSKWNDTVCRIHRCMSYTVPPALNHTDYYNRKGWYSVVLQGIVDSNYFFVMCVWVGQAVCMTQEFLLIWEYLPS